ncbi:MAG: hypothetical protein ABI538_05240 [Pseudoxanthomonas sp.]
MSDNAITGEVSNSKIAAVFDTTAAARAAAAAVAQALDLQPAQVQVITPDEPHADAKLEPESRGIWRTIVVAHLRLCIVGAIVGALVFALMMWLGVLYIVQSPWAAGLVMTGFGALAGLMLGGLVALRPDHDRYIQATHDAMAERRTTVLVHAFSVEQKNAAADFMSARGGEVTRTL